MKKILRRILPVLAIALITAVVSGFASAQSEFTTTYYTNNTAPGAPAGMLRLSNDGASGGKLCAMIYVYAANQSPEECCGCPVTKNGLVEENVKTNLLGNTLTASAPNQGAIQIIATTDPGVCDPTSFTTSSLAHGLTVWTTHIEDEVGTTFPISVTQNSPSKLSAKEMATLQNDCLGVTSVGSGLGVCTCNAEATN